MKIEKVIMIARKASGSGEEVEDSDNNTDDLHSSEIGEESEKMLKMNQKMRKWNVK